MTAFELISFIYQVLFIGLFAAVLRHAFRRPDRASIDTVLLFGAIAGVVAVNQVSGWLGFAGHPTVTGLIIALLALVPYAMLRLVDDFRGTPGWVQLTGLAGFLAIAVLGFVAFEAMEQLVELAAIVFFLLTGGYAAVAFAAESRRSRGITRRRMAAVAAGAVLFIGALVVVFLSALLPDAAEVLSVVVQLSALSAVVAFFLGFAPPTWIRRAWREPDLRRFLQQSIHLAGVADERQAVRRLNQAAATAFGANGASIGLAVPERGVLRYLADASGEWVEYPDDAFIAGRAFRQQRRVVALEAAASDPEHAETYRASGATTVIAAPISTEARRLGVLSIFADRRPVFVEDDLWLLELLADQVAILLEARELTEHASALRAREEAARLKEEFLSAAAHDLRTPLTVVLGQAELLERRLRRDPDARVDAASVERMAREARRLSDLVTELLDAQRLEQGAATMERVPTDLRAIITEVHDRYREADVALVGLGAAAPIIASVDAPRVEQVLDNLVENAVKYTPDGDPPEIRVSIGEAEVELAVIDHGIGIPGGDRPRIFERFFRASNAASITDTGLGLGLYICHRIVEEHGGSIRFEPTPGGGTTFAFTLPLLPAGDPSPTEDGAAWGTAPETEAMADA